MEGEEEEEERFAGMPLGVTRFMDVNGETGPSVFFVSKLLDKYPSTLLESGEESVLF